MTVSSLVGQRHVADSNVSIAFGNVPEDSDDLSLRREIDPDTISRVHKVEGEIQMKRKLC